MDNTTCLYSLFICAVESQLLSFALYGKISGEKGVFHFMRMEDLQMLMNSGEYLNLVQNIKQEIQSAQYRAALNVNRELICLYYDIGSAINEHKTWGNKFIENFATDIRLAFVIYNIWQNLLRSIQIGNLCRRCLHKFHGLIM